MTATTSFNELEIEQQIETVNNMSDKDELKSLADFLEVSYSGNTGVDTLKKNILNKINENNDDPVLKALIEQENKPKEKTNTNKEVSDYTNDELYEMNQFNKSLPETLRRRIVRAKATRLHRVKITNLDPADAEVPGMIVTCYNKYCGKVSKYIPFGDENEYGYHVPEIILDDLKERKYALRKEIKNDKSQFGVKQYKTVMVRKFNIERLPDLTKEQIEELKKAQSNRVTSE